MLYVFHVDSGRMMSFDMNLALETVQFLKETIERHHAIPAFSQVLLVSGGENLDARNRVCSYTAGTDTNPIYMFSTIPDTRNQSAPWPSIDNDNDLKSEVDACLELPPTYNTVVRRAQLAQQICEMGREELKMCEKLVHEQHLQHQGWTAVIANMEDITVEFEKKAEDYMKIFEEHMERRTAYKDYLENFDVDLEKLSRIPILPPLIKGAEDKPFNAFDDVYAEDKAESENKTETNEAGNAEDSEQSDTAKSDEKSSSGGEKSNGNQALTLLQWISSSENHKSLRRMAESCTKELEIFDKKIMDKLKIDINNAIDHARRDDMKEIKGLEERLRGLENLMSDARKTVQEQNELAQAFQLNQNRAANLGDPSILPDLCNSHRSQLLVMLKNNKKLRDIHMRCAKAKDELGKNLVQRLKYIIHIENKMYEIDNTLLFYHRCLRRLQTHLGIIEQIHQAPCIYVQAVTEVVRRKIFSSAYLMWASDLARHLITIYKDEVDLREKFKYVFEGHFLTTLFPGIDDIPPKFATDAPSVFDGGLPNLSREDLSELDTYLPDLTKENQLPNLDTIIEFFSFRSFKNSSDKSIETSDKSCEKYQASNKKILSLRSHHKELLDKEIESETDTEEYEKVTSQPLPEWRNVSVDATILVCDNGTLTDPMSTTDSETLTEENLHTSKIEVEKLKEIITMLKQTYQEALKTLKQELSNIKQHATNERGEFEKLIEELSKSFDKLKEETKNNERELIQRLTVDHELEMNDLRKSLYEKNDELAVMMNDKKNLEEKYNEISMRTSSERDLLQRNIDTLKDRVLLLETQLKDANNSKALAVKEIKDKLQHDHRNEIESLRCKFKLMTNMERSPSDTSLEKIERPDILEIGEHEAIVNQLKENFEVEKEKAIKEAVEMEKQKFQQQISETFVRSNIPESPKSFTSSSQDIMRRLVEEKERQLDKLREHTNHLQRENNRLKETIQTLTDSDVDVNAMGNLKERIEVLHKEKSKIERELEKEKNKRAKLLSSCQNATGVTINSCSKNDNVMVVYNSGHNQYTVVQDSPLLYFLHAESYSGLNLVTIQPNQIPKICYCIGKVIDKEYCHAKKDENRYKVGKGTKFYRVKVRPLSPSRDMEKSTMERRKRRERQSITDSTITIETSTTKLSENQMERNSQVITSQLIDSFAQTDINLGASTSSSTHDMVDSGVDSSGNKSSSIYKERNISVTEEDEPISLSDDRFRYKSVSEEDDIVDDGVSHDAEKKKDEIEASGLLTTTNTTAIDDSDEYRSFSETKDEDTEL